ncbi:hypothetical protein B0I27_101458 [Arcticibacter pallidicorallinus]|uniref:Uncharacterized protein n=1 Tax=Arcticibacter pallidicorallinus TaxID=1259464 RepID=A0A2T0UC22_9SPHI|nr:hypothetical protein [Arcticibacter pallidicorallinus]PRY55486.1 hypothetical protein B0I27_101458 [Arcticibacter pallidicorallinus]
MGFWQDSRYTYQQFAELSLEKVILQINALSREDMVEWLNWNDPNGIYSDEQSLKELGNRITKEEATEIMLRQIEENTVS